MQLERVDNPLYAECKAHQVLNRDICGVMYYDLPQKMIQVKQESQRKAGQSVPHPESQKNTPI